jgi:hypothetical protein
LVKCTGRKVPDLPAAYCKEVPVIHMDVWTINLLAIGGFIAVTSLVRLMCRRRDALLAELTAQARDEQHRQRLADILEKKKQKKKAA